MSKKAVVVTLSVQAVILALLLTVALDQYVHAKTDSIDGVNHRGYRGDVAFRHSGTEARLMLAGGSRAFASGVVLRETMLMRLQAMLARQEAYAAGPITAFNVAAPGPRGSYVERLERYRGLSPDVVCIYVDLAPASSPQPAGPLARRVYVPALPPAAAIDSALGRLMPARSTPTDEITSVADAVTTAIAMARGTVVAVPQPSTPDEQVEYASLMQALGKFDGNPRVTIVMVPTAATAADQTVEAAVAAALVPAVRAFLSQMQVQ